MSDEKHTPPPWHVSKYTDGRAALIYGADDFEVARACYPNRDANAHLIAASPRLYKALDRLDQLERGMYGWHEDTRAEVWAEARAALAAARGEQA